MAVDRPVSRHLLPALRAAPVKPAAVPAGDLQLLGILLNTPASASEWSSADLESAAVHSRGVEAVLAKPYRPIDLLQALARTDLAA